MHISAQIHTEDGQHEVTVTTNDQPKSLAIPPKAGSMGSAVNGGELLFLALATCYCNDICREAEKLNIPVQRIEVAVEGEFGGPGEPAKNIAYRARVTAQASAEEIQALMQKTDSVAEIQNTLRAGVPVSLVQLEAVPV